jgi:D-alanyl-D-alanine carboxypeptidase
VRRVLIVACAALAACSQPSSAPTDMAAATISDGGPLGIVDLAMGPAPPDLAVAPRSAACLALDAKLQMALDKKRMGTTCKETALAVETPACPLMSYVSSDDANAPTDHTYRIASNTKTFTAGVILKLAAQGKLGLDDLASTYLPSTPGLTGMTIRQILSHNAGLYNYTSDSTFISTKSSQPTKVWTPAELIEIAHQHGPYCSPGACYAYSNTDYIVAGLIAQQVGGMEISALIRTMLLTPYGVPNIYFDGEEAAIGTLAQGYDGNGDEISHKFDQSWIWAAGAMVATTADLSRWMKMLGSGQIHDPTIQAQLEDGVSTGQAGATYGLGVFMYDASYGPAGRSIGHIGSVLGYHSESFYYPDTQVTITNIVTCEDEEVDGIRAAVENTLFP